MSDLLDGAQFSEATECLKLAQTHAPVLHLDEAEPFLPSAVGIVIHTRDGASTSADYEVSLQGAKCAIEYAIWWDWDIQHLYELEHLWVYLDTSGKVCRVVGSAHGQFTDLCDRHENLPLEEKRVRVYAEPGKHAMVAEPDTLRANYAITGRCCGSLAGDAGILVPEIFPDGFGRLRPYDYHIARRFMQSKAFKPTYRFNHRCELGQLELLPWDELKASIPNRVSMALQDLRDKATGIKAVFVDSGDTLIDESSQVFCADEVVLQAQPIPGGDKLVASLKERGHLVALVADGKVASFENVHKAMGFWNLFDAYAISETVGVQKPDRRMFDAAADALGLNEDDYPGCVMLGNNLERDIAGANRLGMHSVWLKWSQRYPTKPNNADEQPDQTIILPHQLLDVLDNLDKKTSSQTYDTCGFAKK